MESLWRLKELVESSKLPEVLAMLSFLWWPEVSPCFSPVTQTVVPELWKLSALRTNITQSPHVPKGCCFFYSLGYTELFTFHGWLHEKASFKILKSYLLVNISGVGLWQTKFHVSLIILERKES